MQSHNPPPWRNTLLPRHKNSIFVPLCTSIILQTSKVTISDDFITKAGHIKFPERHSSFIQKAVRSSEVKSFCFIHFCLKSKSPTIGEHVYDLRSRIYNLGQVALLCNQSHICNISCLRSIPLNPRRAGKDLWCPDEFGKISILVCHHIHPISGELIDWYLWYYFPFQAFNKKLSCWEKSIAFLHNVTFPDCVLIQESNKKRYKITSNADITYGKNLKLRNISCQPWWFTNTKKSVVQ